MFYCSRRDYPWRLSWPKYDNTFVSYANAASENMSYFAWRWQMSFCALLNGENVLKTFLDKQKIKITTNFEANI